MTVLLIFALAILVAAIVPGPDFAMVVRNTVMSGRASGMWTAIGIALGVSVWVVAASVRHGRTPGRLGDRFRRRQVRGRRIPRLPRHPLDPHRDQRTARAPPPRSNSTGG